MYYTFLKSWELTYTPLYYRILRQILNTISEVLLMIINNEHQYLDPRPFGMRNVLITDWVIWAFSFSM